MLLAFIPLGVDLGVEDGDELDSPSPALARRPRPPPRPVPVLAGAGAGALLAVPLVEADISTKDSKVI